MQDVDESHRQSSDDVEERHGQQHQRRRRLRRLLVLECHTATAAQVPTTSSACVEKSSNDQHVEDDGGQRCNKVEHQLRQPYVDSDGCRHRPSVARVILVRVDVGVERRRQQAADVQTHSHLHT